jgi:NAD(P) transhydrogenase subunit alpha
MIIGIPKEIHSGERRVAIVPSTIGQLKKLGYSVIVEKGAGMQAHFPDALYQNAGVEVVETPLEIWERSDLIIKIRAPEMHPVLKQHEASLLRRKSCLIAMLDPSRKTALVNQLAETGATTLSVDAIPRISRAQSMDVLSSMANISGYRAMIEATHLLGRLLPGQITAAGKIPPAKVLVIGAGVAGLSAIGTAKSLGAVVRAYDTRVSVKEEVESMGAKFLELELAEEGKGAGGYAKVMSQESIEAEMNLFREQVQNVDILITTAAVPGKRAPKLITEDMVQSMRPGSVIVDLAAENGGNCELTKAGKIIRKYDVLVVGFSDLPSRQPTQSSQLYSNNMLRLVQHMGGASNFKIDLEDEIIRSILVSHEGTVTWPPPETGQPTIVKADEKTHTSELPGVEAAVSHQKVPEHAFASRIVRGTVFTIGALLLVLVGFLGSPDFLTHLTVFTLACFVGYSVVWDVAPALHTPLMSVTNAISGIIVIGGLISFATSPWLSGIAVFIATINIFGGFFVTRRMLDMFHK